MYVEIELKKKKKKKKEILILKVWFYRNSVKLRQSPTHVNTQLCWCKREHVPLCVHFCIYVCVHACVSAGVCIYVPT